MNKDAETPFILVDGSSYFYRAYHALPPLMNSKGQATGAIYGVINMLNKLVREYHPKYMAVVFDAKGKTFRHEMYPEYKATRPPMPDELVSQIEPLHKLIQAMNLPILAVEGVEADDVIGTLAKQAKQQGMKVLISTSDKDLAQLVDQDVSLINTMTNTFLDPKGVYKKFGVKPEQIIDYLTLVGDTSDNVPGVPKVGPKTAVKWLEEYGSLDEIIKHADEIKGKVGENLRASLDQLPLSKELVTIKCDVKLNVKPEELLDKKDDDKKLIELLKELEFKAWLSELLQEEQKTAQENHYQAIFDEKKFEALLKELKQSKLFSVDTETTSLNYMEAEIVGVSFALRPHEAFYIPLMHSYENAPKQLDRKKVLAQLKPILEDPSIKKLGQNLKYDKEIFANHDIELNGIEFDTMLESYILNSTSSGHDLDSLALKYLGYKTIKYEDVAGKGAKQIPFSEVPVEKATPYAAEDADIALQLHEKLWPEIEKDSKLKKVFLEIEMPLLNVLSRVERTGVLIDVDFLKQQSLSLEKRLSQLQDQIYILSGEDFNIDSPKQLQEVLYDKLKLPILKKTPTGQASTAEPVLQELAYDFELPQLILEYRSLNKLKTTYTDKLPQQVEEKTGRVHTSYHQAVTSTGRLSSSDPNLQNIPIRTEAGKQIRKAFIAPKGYQILASDYSQIELRIMAHLSKDKGLLKAFENGFDIHRATAAEIFDIPIDQVTHDQRRKAKAINFGLIYGMSAFGLAKQIGVSRSAAQQYINAYFKKYPGVERYMDEAREFAHQHGYVETYYGRRLHIPEINAKNKQVQNAAERAAINAPMQGTAADIIKIAMINIDTWLRESKRDIRMIMQVHDELVFEVSNEIIDTAVEKIRFFMDNAIQLSVPISVDIGMGNNWEEAH